MWLSKTYCPYFNVRVKCVAKYKRQADGSLSNILRIFEILLIGDELNHKKIKNKKIKNQNYEK